MRRILISKRSLKGIRLGIRGESKMLLNQRLYSLDKSLELRSVFFHGRRFSHERRKGSAIIFDAYGRGPFTSFDDNLDLSVILFLRLQNSAKGANAIDLLWSRLVHRSVVLGSKKYSTVGRQCLFEGTNRPGTANFECDFRKGKDYDIANWHHWIFRYVGGDSIRVFFHT